MDANPRPRRMIPAIPADSDGIDPTAHRIPFDAGEIACLLEVIDASQSGRPVSFKIPASDHGEHS